MLATTEEINMAKKSKDKKYMISAEIVKVDEASVLTITIFNIKEMCKGDKRPQYRTFLTREDYITQDFTGNGGEWKTGALVRILDISYWCGCGNSLWSRVGILNRESEEELKKFLQSDNEYLQEIDKIQEKIMEARLKVKHKKITDPIDEEMNKVKELPNDFKEWIDRVAFYDRKYIYYEYTNKKLKHGYCTYCKKDVIMEKPKHNTVGMCPSCGEEIIYKSLGKSKHVKDYSNAAILQKLDDGRLIVREFEISKVYEEHYRNPRIGYYEKRRTIWKGREHKIYEWAIFKQKENRWCNNEGNVCIGKEALYDKNLEILQGSLWHYSGLKELATGKKGNKMRVINYMHRYLRYPFLEYISKTKLFRLANEITESGYDRGSALNTKRNSLKDILGLTRDEVKILQRMNLGFKGIEILKDVRKGKIKITEEEIKCISEELSWSTVKKLSCYTSIRKIIKYINEQSKDLVKDNTLRDYLDYIEECKKLKFDLKSDFILFPKNLRERHRETSMMIKVNENKKNDSQLKKINKELYKLYGWENEKYKIIIPSCSIELIEEGQALHHCVGGYIKRMCDRSTTILFIRKKDKIDKSFYTMEIRDNTIIQCRTIGNDSYTLDKKVKKVVNEYDRKILKPLREEMKRNKVKVSA